MGGQRVQVGANGARWGAARSRKPTALRTSQCWYDISGALIQELTGRDLPAGPAELYIHLGTLAAGNYIVRLEGNEGFSKTERLVKL